MWLEAQLKAAGIPCRGFWFRGTGSPSTQTEFPVMVKRRYPGTDDWYYRSMGDFRFGTPLVAAEGTTWVRAAWSVAQAPHGHLPALPKRRAKRISYLAIYVPEVHLVRALLFLVPKDLLLEYTVPDRPAIREQIEALRREVGRQATCVDVITLARMATLGGS